VLQGALTSIYLASSPEVEGVSSKYFDKCRPIPSSPISYDLDVAVKLWDVSKELTEAKAKATVAV
jgi:retinol dehydrogenase-14